MPMSISGSVGNGGANHRADVRAVQRLLNQAAATLQVSGRCDASTVAAIVDYQRNFLARPDGVVDPGGFTWRHLIKGRLKLKSASLILLPQQAGGDYYSYATADRQFGTQVCIDTLIQVCGAFHEQVPGVAVGIGDISFQQGGPMSPHTTHKEGRHVDIRPVRKDTTKGPTDISAPTYSHGRTALLVQSLLAHPNVMRILFNDAAIQGVTPFKGHHNHLHIVMKA